MESSHSARIRTPGGSMRRVKFDMEAADSKTHEKKRKGGSKGLRPSFPVHRQDMLQYPNYTNYFKGDDGTEFQEQQGTAQPATAQAAVSASPSGGAAELQPAYPPPTGGSRLAGASDGLQYVMPHPLDEAMPLPRTSNMQVLEPINYEGWEYGQPDAGTRGFGMNPPRDVYGNERPGVVGNVPRTLKMAPATEANERYQAIEDPVRRGLKTISAQNLQMGGVGIGGRDPSRGFLIHPQELKFGRVEADKQYQLRLTLMNAGIDSSRFQVRKPKGVDVRYKTGMVAAGMSVVLQVVLAADVGTVGRDYEEQIQIVTENEVFRIPVTGAILSAADFENTAPNQRTSAPEYVVEAKPPGLSRAPPAPLEPPVTEDTEGTGEQVDVEG